MKISTGSSSSSVASDSLSRKSTLCIYTDSDYVQLHEKPDCGSQAMELRRELDSVQRALHLQSETVLRQRHRMVELTQQLSARDDRAARERQLRDTQLAAVLRSLYHLEARLKKEQAALQNRLEQRDTVIRWQKEEILKLKAERMHASCRCPKAERPGIARSNSCSEKQEPFQKNSRLSKSFHFSRKDDVTTSSGEESIAKKQSFVRKDATRRSRKYSGRKFQSSYLDSLKKKCDEDRASSRIDELLMNPEVETFSDKIEALHGIKGRTDSEKPWYMNTSDPEPDVESSDNLLVEAYSEVVLNDQAVSAKNEVILSKAAFCNKPSQAIITSSRSYNEKHVTFLNNGNVTDANWYASTSDHDDHPSSEIYKNNPVLECVNQILLQNSLDETNVDVDTSPKTKRVQFSAINSISLPERNTNGKIVKFNLETASEHSYEVPKTAEGYNYEVQSIYSNDYEPVATVTAVAAAQRLQRPQRPVPLPRVRSIAASLDTKIVNKRKVPRMPPALPPKPKNLTAKRISAEPDYCSISEINVPVATRAVLTQPSIEIHTEKPSPKVKNRIEIPKLPQVTEIIIPDDDESKDSDDSTTETPKPANRSSIQIGNSVSSILSELNREKINSNSNLIETLVDDVDKFDLSQNFEEFKIDECEFDALPPEEYKISSEGSDSSGTEFTVTNYRIEFSGINGKTALKNGGKMTNKPDLLSNIDSVETDSVRNSDIESSNSSGSNSGSYNTVKYEPTKATSKVESASNPENGTSFEYFLESSGLSSKAILVRPPNSNHKSVLKPKDVKMRVRNSGIPKPQPPANTTAIKYFEPYL